MGINSSQGLPGITNFWTLVCKKVRKKMKGIANHPICSKLRQATASFPWLMRCCELSTSVAFKKLLMWSLPERTRNCTCQYREKGAKRLETRSRTKTCTYANVLTNKAGMPTGSTLSVTKTRVAENPDLMARRVGLRKEIPSHQQLQFSTWRSESNVRRFLTLIRDFWAAAIQCLHRRCPSNLVLFIAIPSTLLVPRPTQSGLNRVNQRC